MSKKIILIIIIIVLLAVGVYQVFLKEKKSEFTLVEVARGNVVQEIFESGQVRKGEKINLSFKNAGIIERIYVEVGEEVKGGALLAKLETVELQIRIQEAKSNLSAAQAKLDKLLAGANPEEIQVAETAVNNAQIALENAKQNLKDVKNLAEENLDNAYKDSLNILDDSYLKTYNAFNVADLIRRTYFAANDQESIRVGENKYKLEGAVSSIKFYLETAKAEPKDENVDAALSETKKALDETSNALKIIREVCETPFYRSIVSSADKTSLDTQRTYINTALTNVADSQKTISSAKLTNEANVNAAQADVSSAEGQLQAAKDNLSLIIAPPRQEDIALYRAQIGQTDAQVKLYENQLQQSNLVSPVDGKIIESKKRIGELVQSTPQDAAIVILPVAPYELKVDIYEENVVKMNVGNSVKISLVAFPRETFEGKIISISPAEKIVEGVVYYETIIGFEEMPENIKPGMTADLVIQADLKEDVLVIPRDTVQRREGKTMVEVFKDGLVDEHSFISPSRYAQVIEEREIEIGLIGSNDMVEVISGLEEGEKVILR